MVRIITVHPYVIQNVLTTPGRTDVLVIVVTVWYMANVKVITYHRYIYIYIYIYICLYIILYV